MRRATSTAIALLFCALLAPTTATAEPAFPYTLAVEIAFDQGGGPESLRQTLMSDLLLKLRSDRCYREVVSASDAEVSPDLVLSILIREYQENVQHDLSLGDSLAADTPSARRRFTATFSLRVDLDLRLAAGGSVRDQRIGIRQQARPRGLAEDESMMREKVREDGTFELIVSAASHVCRGSLKKLEKQIDKARAQAASR